MKTTYSTAAFADAVGVSKSALKYFIVTLENSGYEIARNSRQHRIFNEQDLHVFKAYKHLHNDRGLTLKEAAKVVASPDFDVEDVEIIDSNQQIIVEKRQAYEMERYDDLSKTMGLLAEHVKGLETQNVKLLQLIQAQQEQNDLLAQQNDALKNEFATMKLQIEGPKQSGAETEKELQRLALQNTAIMATLNRINVEKHNEEIKAYEEQKKEQSKSAFKKFFGL